MLTALAGAEPVVGVSGAAVQRLQFFVSESTWDAEAVNARRLELLAAEAATAAHAGGVLVVDDSGDRKDGHATAHVARQYLGSVGKTDNGIVAVPTLWADERVYYPLHVVPYTPAGRLPGGGRGAVCRGGGRLFLRSERDGHPGRCAGAGRVAVRAGAQAAHEDLGTGRGGAQPGRGRRRSGLALPAPAGWLAAGDPPVPRRAHRDLVGRRRPAGRLGPGPAGTAGDRLVVGREEERRRPLRDLHDGLGPAPAGVALGVDAARNTLRSDRTPPIRCSPT